MMLRLRYYFLLLTVSISLTVTSQPLLKAQHFGAAEGLVSPGINCLAEDRDGFIWIGSNMGLTRFDGIHFRNFPIKYEKEGSFALQPRRMTIDEQNRIWFSTRRGLFVFDIATGNLHKEKEGKEPETLQKEQSIDSHLLSQIDWQGYLGGARCMLKDHEGGVWIGSFYEGLFYIKNSPNRFHCITTGQKPLIVRPICSCQDGSVYVGTENKGLFRWNADDNELTPIEAVSADNIQSIVSSGDTLWIATFGEGIYLYHLKEKRIIKHYHADDGTSGLRYNFVVCILRTHDGDLIVGTTQGLLMKQRGASRFEIIDATDGFIHALAQTTDGTVWAGSLDRPLRRITRHQGKWQSTNDKVFTYPCVTSLMADGEGRLWIGTDSKGVWLREPNGTCHETLLTDRQMNSSSNAIASDTEGNLWVSTFNGLFCMDKKNKTVSRFSQDNGLPTNFFSYSSSILLDDGQMMMGTHNGLVAFNPTQFRMPLVSLHPFITNVRIGDRDTIVNKELTLDYDAPSVTIEYAASTFAHQPEVWYRYRITGMGSEEWQVLQGGDGRIYFGHLASGNYCLQLQASMNPNTWEGTVTQLNIVVKSPWWRSPWAFFFYTLFIVCIATMLWRIWRHRVERDALRQQITHLLENQELMRSTPQMSPYDLIKDIAPKNQKGDDFMKRVDDYLEDHVTDNQLGVDTISVHMNMSNSTFYRRMKSATSLSPNEYIRLYRLKKAALLLRQEGKSIREVSEMLCFSSVAYFTNCFSRQFGITPGEYERGKN